MSRRHPLDDLDQDIQDHIERETQDNLDRGMTPEEARLAALRAFGSVARATERTRAVWVPRWLDELGQDARYGLRMLRRQPVFAAIVAATLAVGVGLNTAVYSVVNAVLVRPLSYPHADRLVSLTTYDERNPDLGVISPTFTEWRDHATTFERLAGFFVASEPIDVGAEVVQARIGAVTHGFWDLAGARFALGGPPPDGTEGVVLTYAFFEQRFGGDASIVGRPVLRYGVPTPVTGVLDAGFRVQLPPPPSFARMGPGEIDFYRAIVIRPPQPNGGLMLFDVVGRARPGVSMAQIQSDLDAIPPPPLGNFKVPSKIRVRPYTDKLVGHTRRPLLTLLGAVVVVLAIACVNIANLLLARGSARQREIAIRTAIGASRGRVMRQMLVEGVPLALMGGLGGLIVARAAIAAVVRLVPSAVPRLAETSIDGRVLAFAVAATVATAIVFGLAPALAWRRQGIYDSLKDAGRTASAARGGLRVRKALVAIELALSVVLLVGAVLMVKSFQRITAYPPGFEPDRVLTLQVQFSGRRYREQPARRAHLDELLRRLRGAPGVEAAGVTSNGDSRTRLVVEGAPELPPPQRVGAMLSAVSGDFARVVGLRVLRGRWIADQEPSAVFVINETLARAQFPGTDPIGRRIRLPWLNETGFGTVVGVVADLRSVDLAAVPEPELFIDYGHAGLFSTMLAVRTAGDPAAAAPAIRALLASADRTQPLFDVRPLEARLAESIAPRRFNTLLLGTFAGCAVLLAVIGIYGVIAYAVAQRTQEIGVRIALGAARRTVVGLVVRQGMTIAAIGVAMGLTAALAASRVMTGLLYEITPTDPSAYVIVAIVLSTTALAACLGPAMAAARVDPLVALRCE